jgi:pimeloyl-ACP methyl ester carboxylesterase
MSVVGGSAATPGGYDAATMAEDVYQLAGRLKLERVYVVGHDLGGTVAYAFARMYPQATRGVTILDVPLPGLDPWDEVTRDPDLWHVGFAHYVVEEQPEAVAALVERHAL